ncbi:hypothetical protein BDV12DRAFT_197407 [Aspergillus spectabilis]
MTQPPHHPSLLKTFTLTLAILLLFTPLTNSLPLPTNGSIQPKPLKTGVQPRSPIPDPRMIPDRTDLLAHIFASLGMEELNKFNKLRPDEHGDDGVVIDDSHNATHTVTAYENESNRPDGVEGKSGGRGGSVHGNQETTTTVETTAGEGEDESEGKDVAEEPDSFVGTLFEVLKKKFREAINSSDEVVLR